jgi:hypothetical protein
MLSIRAHEAQIQLHDFPKKGRCNYDLQILSDTLFTVTRKVIYNCGHCEQFCNSVSWPVL